MNIMFRIISEPVRPVIHEHRDGRLDHFCVKILVGQGAFTSYLPARDGAAYSAKDDYFGGQAVWADFSAWQAKIPSVNYGIYTNEADAAVTAQIPGLVAGGSIDDAIVAIDAQIEQQIQ